MSKSTRLTIRLGAEVRAWLKAQGEQRGLNEAAFARLLMYGAMNGAEELPVRFTLPADQVAAPNRHHEAVTSPTTRAPAPGRTPPAELAPLDHLVTYEQVDAALEAAGEEHAEEIDVPADADGEAGAQLEALMQAAPSFLDELVERSRPRAAAAIEQRQPPRIVNPDPRPRNYRQGPVNALARQMGGRPDHRRAFGVAPGSLTRVVGVGEVGGNMQGDGFGNVRRDNMRHFGIVGTRAR